MRAVDVEPVLADKVGLVEQCAVGAEEAVLGKPAVAIGGAHVESLALSFGVRVVTWQKRLMSQTFVRMV